MVEYTQFQSLGLQRARVLSCLGGDNPRLPGYFAPAADADRFEAFRSHVAKLSRQWAADPDPTLISLLATARFLTGDLAAADVVLDHLPSEAPKSRYGQAYCPLVPVRTLNATLPLPPNLTDTGNWLAGSATQSELQAWLSDNRASLRWVEADAVWLRVV